MGYGDAFLEGFDRQFASAKNARERLLMREMEKRRMQLAEAASERAEMRDQFDRQQALAATARQGYTDRTRWLDNGTEPFKALQQTYPEAGAADEVARIFQLNEDIARQPNKLDPTLIGPRGVVQGPPQRGFDSPAPGGVTRMGEREALIGDATALFGTAKLNAEARKNASDLAEKAAGRREARAGAAYTRDLEIEQREIGKLERAISMMRQGYIIGPSNTWEFVGQMNDPQIKATLEAQIKQMEAQLTARVTHLQKLQQENFGRTSIGGDPEAYYVTRIGQGIPEAQVLEEMKLRGMEVTK